MSLASSSARRRWVRPLAVAQLGRAADRYHRLAPHRPAGKAPLRLRKRWVPGKGAPSVGAGRSSLISREVARGQSCGPPHGGDGRIKSDSCRRLREGTDFRFPSSLFSSMLPRCTSILVCCSSADTGCRTGLDRFRSFYHRAQFPSFAGHAPPMAQASNVQRRSSASVAG
jgi:hypothetical protein